VDSRVRREAAIALEKLGWEPSDTEERIWMLISKEEWDKVIETGERGSRPLIQVLWDDNVSIREEAIKALGAIRDERAIKPLIYAFKDDYGYIREEAIKAVIKIGRPAVEHLLFALEGEDSDIRAGATIALGEIGDESATEPLIHALEDEEWNVRAAVIEALVKIGGKNVIESLIRALEDEEPEVRAKAAGILGDLRDERAVGALTCALKDGHWRVRREAAEALEKLGWEASNELEGG